MFKSSPSGLQLLPGIGLWAILTLAEAGRAAEEAEEAEARESREGRGQSLRGVVVALAGEGRSLARANRRNSSHQATHVANLVLKLA